MTMRIGINGVGIAGPTLAYWLRRFGHQPMLFEQAPQLRRGGYVIDFWGMAFEIADRMGVVPALLEHGYRMARVSFVDGDGHEIAGLDVTAIRERLNGRFISLARADLAATLFQVCDGVPTHFGVSIAGLVHDRTGVTAMLSNGREERFDLVVGADGLHSHIRQLAFGSESRFIKGLDCHVAAFRLPGYPHRNELTYVSHTVPKRQVARISLRDDDTLVLLVCRSELIDCPTALHHRKAALRLAFGGMGWEVPEILDRLDEVEDLYFDGVSQIHLRRWSNGRVAVIGDAAACASLLAGEGTGLAMIEAYVLAGELHWSGGDVVRALGRFEARLREFVAAKQRSALRLRGFFAPRTAVALRLRNVAVAALALPVLGTRLIDASLMDDVAVPDYLTAPVQSL